MEWASAEVPASIRRPWFSALGRLTSCIVRCFCVETHGPHRLLRAVCLQTGLPRRVMEQDLEDKLEDLEDKLAALTDRMREATRLICFFWLRASVSWAGLGAQTRVFRRERGGGPSSRLRQVQEKGAEAVYRGLPPKQQKAYENVSAMELAAFAHWRQEQADGAAPDPVAAWDALPEEEKEQWVPEDPAVALADGGAWRSLGSFFWPLGLGR